MNDNIIALVDCDSFFVSCEQSVNKELQKKAVCVLGNNNSCVLARSKEAKEMGVKMGMPYFIAKKDYPDCIYISGNMSLYKDFSRNVMKILRDFSPLVEVYSIDEAFIELSGLKKLYGKNYLGIAKMIREKIKSQLDINVSIGLSSTKVLAKLACEKAKNTTDGIYLIGNRKISKELKSTKIEEIWGIGKKTTLLLNRWGILDCQELIKKSDEWLKIKIGKRGIELKHELLGECIDKVKNIRRLPKSIQNTRTFSKITNDKNYIKNALNVHIHNSCTRLRYLGGKCLTVGVMLKTKDFNVFYDKKNLSMPTNFELDISKVAIEVFEKMYSKDLIYRSCGVTLENLNFNTEEQLQLFVENTKNKNREKLAHSIDKLEKKFGKNIVKTGFLISEE